MDYNDTASKVILMVDDDRAVCALVGAYLKRDGYSVLTATGGSEAISIFQRHQARVVLLLTDVRMPRIDGLRLADTILRLRPKLPVIFISGNMHQADRGYGCIAKPFTLGEIVGRVRQVLALSELRGHDTRPHARALGMN